jgi:hypothetical protein
MQRTTARRGGTGQAFQIKTPIDIVEEAGSAVDPTLDDMHGHAGKLESWRAGHSGLTQSRAKGLSADLFQENCSDPFSA